MKSFKNFITEQEISKGDMKKLQRAAAAKTPEQAQRILSNLESSSGEPLFSASVRLFLDL